MTTENRNNIIKLQAVLTAIANKTPVFFNVTNFKEWGLVKEHGERECYALGYRRIVTNWVLTQKAKQILNVQI